MKGHWMLRSPGARGHWISALACALATLALTALVGAGTASALPPGYSYQMVSAVDKNGDGVGGGLFEAGGRASADGSRFLYGVPNGFGDTEIPGHSSGALATRGADSWTSHVLNPFHVSMTGPYTPVALATSPDLTKSIWASNADPVSRAARPREDFWLRDNYADTWQLLTVDPAPGGAPYVESPGFQPARVVDATPDFGAILFETRAELTADAVGLEDSLSKLYRWEAGQVTLEGQIPSVPPGPGGEVPAAVSAGGKGGVLNENFISDDGKTSFFTLEDGIGETEGLLYRRDANGTVLVAAEENPEQVLAPGPTVFRGASADGSRVFFTSQEELLSGDQLGDRDLFMYTAGPDPAVESNLTRLSVDGAPDDGTSAQVEGVLGISQDGHRVYFSARGQVIDGGPTSPEVKIFLWDDSSGTPIVKYVAGLDEGGSSGLWSPTAGTERRRVTVDGSRLMFTSSDEGLTADTTAGVRQAFMYDAASSTPLSPHNICLSCGPSGPATSEVTTQGETSALALPLERRRWLSADGTKAIFQTATGLLPTDTNEVQDVYMWDDGSIYLISSGRDSFKSVFLDADLDAGNVFFTTKERLLGRDHDAAVDVYAATTEPAMAEPAGPARECVGDECQLPAGLSGPAPSAATKDYVGTGNVKGARRGKAKRCKAVKAGRVRGKHGCKGKKSHSKRNRDANTNRRQGR